MMSDVAWNKKEVRNLRRVEQTLTELVTTVL